MQKLDELNDKHNQNLSQLESNYHQENTLLRDTNYKLEKDIEKARRNLNSLEEEI